VRNEALKHLCNVYTTFFNLCVTTVLSLKAALGQTDRQADSVALMNSASYLCVSSFGLAGRYIGTHAETSRAAGIFATWLSMKLSVDRHRLVVRWPCNTALSLISAVIFTLQSATHCRPVATAASFTVRTHQNKQDALYPHYRFVEIWFQERWTFLH